MQNQANEDDCRNANAHDRLHLIDESFLGRSYVTNTSVVIKRFSLYRCWRLGTPSVVDAPDIDAGYSLQPYRKKEDTVGNLHPSLPVAFPTRRRFRGMGGLIRG